MGPSASPAGHFVVLYFAAAASYTGKTSEHLASPMAAGELFGRLEQLYPGIRARVLESCAVTVNLQYINLDGDDAEGARVLLKEGDEVAIIPPVSSG
ncbi:Molybdopterin synthase sulfur carrier subunit [Sporormia fimetaria CBS 119925]|uniref:Molybdopterin synthase sulfur carrier subunit n=1 Tax=Sporormia fimetaria CBS 119925 TaxID=1340428 RepID=A0A6A6VFL6_9PLEO|nr:Molybdopterin synthase sulfur carrier subunit [Sporormia fimetaria CBS 119925]